MKLYVANAFSLGMIDNMLEERHRVFSVTQTLSSEEAQDLLESFGEFTSCVGHPDTAAIFTNILGVSVPMDRTAVALLNANSVLVGQIPVRLPEGTTELPANVIIRWRLVTVFHDLEELAVFASKLDPK